MKLFLAIWIMCGVLSYGITFAYFQRKYPDLADLDYDQDLRVSVINGLLGPFGLVGGLMGCNFAKYGIKFR